MVNHKTFRISKRYTLAGWGSAEAVALEFAALIGKEIVDSRTSYKYG
jgi:hypothetical protein